MREPENTSSPNERALIKRISGNIGIGLIGSGLMLVLTVGRTIVLANLLDITTFGLVVICTNFVGLLRLILRVGVSDTILRYLPQFTEEDDAEAAGSLLWLVVYISLIIAGVVLGITYFGIDWIAWHWYENRALAAPLAMLAAMSALFTLAEGNGALMRFRNQFHLAVITGVLGAVISFAGVLIFASQDSLDLSNAVLAVALGDASAITIGSILWFLSAKKWMRLSRRQMRLDPIRRHWRKIRSTLTHTSILGLLQSGSEVGGTFLLGIFGTPAQVAIMGMAVQLSRPLKMLQGSVANAVTPEIHKLYAQRKLRELVDFIRRYALISLVLVITALTAVWPLLYWLVPIVLRPEYIAAIPVFLVLALAGGLMLPFQPLLPVAIARGEMGIRNLMSASRLLYLGIGLLGGLTAMGVALAQLGGCLTVRLLSDYPLFLRIKKEASK